MIKTTNGIEKPRFMIFGMQTDKRNQILKNNGTFDHCNLTNFTLYLKSENYPYENIN